MKNKNKRRWIAILLISAILSGILASNFSVSAQTSKEQPQDDLMTRDISTTKQEEQNISQTRTPQVNLYINNEKVDVKSYLINDTTYVPLRAICEEIDDCQISWNNGIAVVDSIEVSMSVQQGSNYIEANERIIYHNQPNLNIDSRIYVPIRSLAKVYSLNVEWKDKTKSVYLFGKPKGLIKGKNFYTEEDLYWLSRIIHAESNGESLRGKIAVGNVIINRKNRNDYPNTVKAVIFDKKYGTQFTPVANGSIYNTPNSESIKAAKIVLDGYSINTEIIFFINPRIASNFWVTKNRTFVIRIGNHDFYK